MTTKFNQCPNCHKRPSSGWLGQQHSKTIYECKNCDTKYCRECGDGRCPNCGMKEKREIGVCYSG